MATFSQWNRTQPLRAVTWLCGPEPALVREVLAVYRAACPADCQVVLWAGAGPDSGVWDVVLTDPLPEFPRLVTVHGAQRLKDFSPLTALLEGAGPDGPRVVFVSAEDDFTTDSGELVPHLAAVKASKHGQLIRCCPPARPADLAALVASWWPDCGPALAWQLLQDCGGSLSQAAEACGKAVRAGLAPGRETAAAVCEAEPGAEFADALIAGDKAAAMAAAQRAGHAETGAGLGLLASRLSHLAALAEAIRGGARSYELAQKAQVNRWLAGRLAPYAPSYDAARVARARELLARAESAHRGGAGAGVAQLVVAGW